MGANNRNVVHARRTRRNPRRNAHPGIVVVGASTGGIPALCSVIGGLPSDFAYPIAAVVHISRTQSLLPMILARCGPLKASHPKNGETMRPGHVYVAPPDRHMIIEDGRIDLSR